MISRIDLSHINKMFTLVKLPQVKNIRYIKHKDGVIYTIRITMLYNKIEDIYVVDFVTKYLKPYLEELGMVITMDDSLKNNIQIKDADILYKSSIDINTVAYAAKEKALIRLAVKALDFRGSI